MLSNIMANIPSPAGANVPPPVVAVVPAAAPRGLARFRAFSPDADLLAQDWSQYAEAPVPWVMDPTVPARPGVEGGFWATAVPYKGYAKPLNPGRANPHHFPIAALEKIASDLAFKVGLPVPPVTLWERRNAPAGEPRYHSVSAPPFAQVLTWANVMMDPALAAIIQPLALPMMSGMMAFDTWLQCEDHVNHPGNLLLTVPAAAPINAAFAFIDYSFSMTHRWRTPIAGGPGFTQTWAAPLYMAGHAPDLAVVREAADAIQQVSDLTIQQIVTRVPDPFLAQGDKALIIDGLIHRRHHLRAYLGV